MSRKKFRSKNMKKDKIFKYKYLIYIICIYLISNLTFYYLKYNKILIDNKDFIRVLLDSSNNFTKKNYNSSKVINEVIKLFSNIDIDSPVTALDTKIASNIIKVDNNDNDNYENIDELVEV